MDNRLLVLIDRAVLHSVPGITHEGGLLFERARHRRYLIRVKWYFCRGHVLGLSSSSMPCLSSLSSLDTSLTTFIIASFVQVDSLSTRNPILHVSTYISQKNNNRRSVVACRAAAGTNGTNVQSGVASDYERGWFSLLTKCDVS